MVVVENLAAAAVTVTSGALTTIAGLSWWYSGSKKVLLVALGFGLFFVKAVVLSVALFFDPSWAFVFLPVALLLDLAILVLFYGAVLQPAGA